jgi:hypothetical protein
MGRKILYLALVKKWLFILFLLPCSLSAQIGGRHIYDFLNLVPSARVSALGGANVSIMDEDPNMAWQNPALMTDSMHQELSLSVVNYLADITYGYAAYAHTFEGIGTFHTGFHYVNYGKFVEADALGNQLGIYHANELAWVVGMARQWRSFSYGLNLKLINSNIAGYNSFGMGFDLGAAYLSGDKLFSAGIVAKNMGIQISKYTPTGMREPLPFELQAGVSYKLQYMPMRFSVVATNLEHPNLIYMDPNSEPVFDLSGNEIKPKKRTGDKIARHFVFSTEFLLGKNLRLRGGYNHLRRQELRSEGRSGLSGFSLGVGLRVMRIRIDYGYSNFHAIGGTHHFSLATNLGRFKKG